MILMDDFKSVNFDPHTEVIVELRNGGELHRDKHFPEGFNFHKYGDYEVTMIDTYLPSEDGSTTLVIVLDG